jgi:hypothetical protein
VFTLVALLQRSPSLSLQQAVAMETCSSMPHEQFWKLKQSCVHVYCFSVFCSLRKVVTWSGFKTDVLPWKPDYREADQIEWVHSAVTLLTRFREMLASNPGRSSGSSDWGFSWFSSAPSIRSHCRFLLSPFQATCLLPLDTV